MVHRAALPYLRIEAASQVHTSHLRHNTLSQRNSSRRSKSTPQNKDFKQLKMSSLLLIKALLPGGRGAQQSRQSICTWNSMNHVNTCTNCHMMVTWQKPHSENNYILMCNIVLNSVPRPFHSLCGKGRGETIETTISEYCPPMSHYSHLY